MCKGSRFAAPLLILSCGSLIYALMQSLLVPALPEFQRELDTNESGGNWILTSFLLGATVVTPAIGRVGDLFGKNRTLVAVMLVFALGSVIGALAGSLGVLLAGRLLQGVGAGMIPLAFGIIRDTFPRPRVAGSIGFVASLIGIGAGAGVVLAGPVLAVSSLDWLFWGPALIAIANAAAVSLFVPESPLRAAGQIDWPGIALLAAGLGAMLLGITQIGSWGLDSTAVWLTCAAGAALLALWVRVEHRAHSPLVDMATMRLRGVWTANACGFLVGLGTYISFVEIPKFAQAPVATGYGLGASVTESGLYLLPWTMLLMAAAQLTGPIDRRFGPRLPLVAGTLLALAAYCLLLVAERGALELLLSSAVMGTGIGLALGALANLTLESVAEEESGVASAVNLVMRLIGGAFGAQAAAAVLELNMAGELPSEHGYGLTFALAALALLVAVAVALAAPSREQLRRPPSGVAQGEGSRLL